MANNSPFNKDDILNLFNNANNKTHILNPDGTINNNVNTNGSSIIDPESGLQLWSSAYFQYLENKAANEELKRQQEEEKAREAQRIIAVENKEKHTYSGTSKLASMLEKVKNKFNNRRPVYTTYLNFMVKINGKWETLVNTASANWLENNLVSFKNEMNGSGKANQFTLTIIFKQNDRCFENINTLESKLLSTCDIVDSTDENGNTIKDLKDIYVNCKFEYGYGDDTTLRSPSYTGRIMTYNCSLDRGQLKYVIKGNSSIISATEIRLSPKDEYKPTESDFGPLDYLIQLFKVEFETEGSPNYGLLNLKISPNCYLDLKTLGVNQNDYTSFGDNKTIIEILTDILAGTTVAENESEVADIVNNKSPNELQTFNFFIDDSVNDGECSTVVIYRNPTYQIDKDKDTSAVTFNWLGTGDSGINHIIRSWNPQYEGSELIALASTIKSAGTKFTTLDDNGEIVEVIGLGAARLGANSTNDALFNSIQECNKWSFITQYPYHANLSTIGLPLETPLLTLINVQAIMNSSEGVGIKHHSSGTYFILGKTDSIDSSGFFSEFKLFKLTKPAHIESAKSNESPTQNESQNDKIIIDDISNKDDILNLFNNANNKTHILNPDGTINNNVNTNIINEGFKIK